jgi:hypothetical protein
MKKLVIGYRLSVIGLAITLLLPAIAFASGVSGGGSGGSLTVPGSDQQVLFNDGGALGANAALTFNKATGKLSAGSLGASSDIQSYGGISANGNNLHFSASTHVSEQHSTTHPQTLNIYNTTDGNGADVPHTNYERGFTKWNSNIFQIGTEKGGSGAAREMALLPNTTVWIGSTTAGSGVYYLSSGGGLVLHTNFNGASGGMAFEQGNGAHSATRYWSWDISGFDNVAKLYESGIFTIGEDMYQTTGYTPEIDIYNVGKQGGSNYERGYLRWSGNVFKIGTEKGGSGTLRALSILASDITLSFGSHSNSITLDGSNERILYDSYNTSWGHMFSISGAGKFDIFNTELRIYSSVTNGTSFYNTTDKTTNYERAFMKWASNVFTIGTEAGGSGVQRTMALALAAIPVYANNAAAVAGGLTAGGLYRTGGDPDALSIVH